MAYGVFPMATEWTGHLASFSRMVVPAESTMAVEL